jgi:hypothetical protein
MWVVPFFQGLVISVAIVFQAKTPFTHHPEYHAAGILG